MSHDSGRETGGTRPSGPPPRSYGLPPRGFQDPHPKTGPPQPQGLPHSPIRWPAHYLGLRGNLLDPAKRLPWPSVGSSVWPAVPDSQGVTSQSVTP
ncbi:MAG: hypothetical protein ACE5R6_11085 [Candidatus Heimdallarchaeota archaeon]